jgi:drug/metabolite transporter (DMT)-like permease
MRPRARCTGLDPPFSLTAYDGFVTGGRSITVATEVLAAVLGAALLHALWNSLVKSAGDKFLTSARVCLWCGVIALAVGCVLPTPDFAAAGFIVASAIIHVGYFVLVGRLYRNADLSVAYPMMRGLAPLIACLIAALTLAEVPKPLTLAGVVILVAGVVTMGLSGLAQGRIDRATSSSRSPIRRSSRFIRSSTARGRGWPDTMRRTHSPTTRGRTL